MLDADGAVIGMLEKDFGKSLLRSHWHVRDATGTEVLEAHESSWIIALLRRFADLGPDYPRCSPGCRSTSRFAAEARRSARTSACSGSSATATCSRSSPAAGDIDRRLLVAFTIGLDALQDR